MKRRRFWLPLALLLLVILAVFALFILKPDYAYRIREAFFLAAQQTELTPVPPNSYTWVEGTQGAETDQALLLVNAEHPLEDGFTAEIAEYRDSDVRMNRCLHEAYASLAQAVSGRYDKKLCVRSAYRSHEEQMQEVEANADLAAPAGTSEHETGLALDVYVPYFAGAGFLKDPAGQYVNLHGWEYGFIIRYPNGKESVTGIPYEPWHIRYVGHPHAEIMAKNALTLEEYIQSLEPNEVYACNGYLISLQTEDALRYPQGCEAVFSPVYRPYWMMTARIPS